VFRQHLAFENFDFFVKLGETLKVRYEKSTVLLSGLKLRYCIDNSIKTFLTIPSSPLTPKYIALSENIIILS